ncbi:thioredoxin family Trp26 protein [Babesia caballi]|uniref:Thioredoxin family Trp26 protein n=1 Tax=Babesia caballi TaxID=5871 RepID=A0AAV4LLB5_BABCB|nr:thioredoxin family Trp26 protein [Babesia caballi]
MHSAGCGCKAEYELGTSSNCLRGQIHLHGVRVFNSTSRPGFGSLIFKPYHSRLSEVTLCNDPSSDKELLFTVPFANPSDISHLLVVNEGPDVLRLKLYVNRRNFDFGDVEAVTPTQELEIPPDHHGSFLHQLAPTKFKDVVDLAMYFEGTTGVEIRYIGLRGSTRARQEGVVDTQYEVVPSSSLYDSLADWKNFKYV